MSRSKTIIPDYIKAFCNQKNDKLKFEKIEGNTLTTSKLVKIRAARPRVNGYKMQVVGTRKLFQFWTLLPEEDIALGGEEWAGPVQLKS